MGYIRPVGLKNGISAEASTPRRCVTMEHYPKAPILEAVLDIQVRASTAPSQDVFLELARSLSTEFPQFADLNLNHLQVSLAATSELSSVAHSFQVSGLRLYRPQNDRVLLIQPRGMTLSHLPPYTSWEDLQPEARRLWERYVEFVKPEGVTRVALRYINKIDLPHPKIELRDYFKLYPEIPSDIPQEVNAFFLQLQMPQFDLAPDLMAAINFTPTTRRDERTVSIVLDLDLYAVRGLPTSSDEVFKLLNLIRTRKNELFEACITDKARGLFR